ncbi:MAG: hypothetical protein KAI79_05690 [Bacteroidales bacterium]|nr:hypothetical protein [Bacteroidales bacterium]
MRIAVDFDGTIVEHRYPKIGKTNLFAFQTLIELTKRGHKLILWTYRSGQYLDEAVEFCKKNGVEFYAINASYPDEIFDKSISRKIDADIYIDDRNLSGFPGWSKVWEILDLGLTNNEILEQHLLKKSTSFKEKILNWVKR